MPMVIFLTVMVMTLYLKRDISAGNRCFTVNDALGEVKYLVSVPPSGLMTRFKLVITDASGNEAARIRRIPLAGTVTYVLRFERKHVTLVTVPGANGISANFYGSNWRITGEFAARNFSIIDVDKTLISEQRNHADYCEINVADSKNELFCVAAAVCSNLINTIDSRALQAV